jgi:hypothetical protein
MGVAAGDRYLDVQTRATGRLDVAGQIESFVDLPQQSGGTNELGKGDTVWVEVKEHVVGAVGPVAAGGPDVEVDTAELDHPEQVAQAVDERIARRPRDLAGWGAPTVRAAGVPVSSLPTPGNGEPSATMAQIR